MRAITLLSAGLLCGLALTAFVFPPLQDDHDDDTPLTQAMVRVEDALKGLRRSVRKPEKNAESLAFVLECQESAIICKRETPAMAANLPEAERPAFVLAYRLEMIRFERALLDLEQAILEGKDTETLREMYKGLKEMEDPAHDRFTEDG